MSIFKTQTGAGNTVILDSSQYSTYSATNKRGTSKAKVSSIYITNNSSHDATVSISVTNIADANIRYNIINAIIIPGNVSLLLDNPFTFDIVTHVLKLTNSGNNADLTLIID